MSPPSSSPLFLGLDLSTQALKASLLDSSLTVLSELAVNFDSSLPEYGTKGGVLLGPPGSGQVFSPVLMAVEAFDRLAERIHQVDWPVERIRAVSAAGQQHASVYWSREASGLLAKLSGTEGKPKMVEQLQAAFSRQIIPNWQDSSTTIECQDFESRIGGASKLAEITGSRAYERFTGPQILRFRREEPKAYRDTDRISLVSSFITTILCADGEVKGIDESDACGMNLWDLSTPTRGWSSPLLDLVSGQDERDCETLGGRAELLRKLGRVESDGGRPVGKIGRWWQERLGFHPDCIVCPATGDNPATLMSFALSPKEALISLGTSDTLLIPTPFFKTSEAYHVFYHPARVARPNATEVDRPNSQLSSSSSSSSSSDEMIGTENAYFNMLVYKNGSLARQAIRDEYSNGSWHEFDQAVRAGWPSSSSAAASSSSSSSPFPSHIGFYWLKAEIIPANAKGIHLYTRDNNNNSSSTDDDDGDKDEIHSGYSRVTAFSQPQQNHPPAIVSSQCLSFLSRIGSILGLSPVSASVVEQKVFDDTNNNNNNIKEGKHSIPPRTALPPSVSSTQLNRIYASGGASSNLTLLQTLSDVLGCEVGKVKEDQTIEGKERRSINACSVGAALKAAWAWERVSILNVRREAVQTTGEDGHQHHQQQQQPPPSFEEFVRHTRARAMKRSTTTECDPPTAAAEAAIQILATPNQIRHTSWQRALPIWKALERDALRFASSQE